MSKTKNRREVIRTYEFHWNDGKVSKGQGRDVADAFTKFGCAALDYYSDVTEEKDSTAERQRREDARVKQIEAAFPFMPLISGERREQLLSILRDIEANGI